MELDFGRTPPILNFAGETSETDSATFMFARG
jgi:hypothetical protein